MEIYRDILQCIASGKCQTLSIIHSANLKWEMLIAYTQTLEADGFITIELDRKHRIYSITPKGLEWLSMVRETEKAAPR